MNIDEYTIGEISTYEYMYKYSSLMWLEGILLFNM